MFCYLITRVPVIKQKKKKRKIINILTLFMTFEKNLGLLGIIEILDPGDTSQRFFIVIAGQPLTLRDVLESEFKKRERERDKI